MSNTLIAVGVIFVSASIVLTLTGGNLELLPGDIPIRNRHLTVSIPITTGLALSVVLTLFPWLST